MNLVLFLMNRFDFRNKSVVDWFINDYVGGPECIGNPGAVY